MYLPRSLISHLYQHLVRTHHALSPPVLLLVALEPDALCACRILTALLKRDYIPHKIQPISGYRDLERAATDLIVPMRTDMGGSGGVVICLGVGGLANLDSIFFGANDDPGDIEVWLMDARRPWNLTNVFGSSLFGEDGGVLPQIGVDRGQISQNYKPGKGGIIVFDDGDIEEELAAEREATHELFSLPFEVQEYDEARDPDGYLGDDDDDGDDDIEGEDDGEAVDQSDSENPPVSGQARKKRKSSSWDDDESEEDSDDEARSKRRRSNSGSSIALSPDRRPPRRGLVSTSVALGGSSDFSRSDSPRSRSESPVVPENTAVATPRQQFRTLLREKTKHKNIITSYENLGQSYSEPVSSLVYSLASELGREDNDLLWNAIVGVSSLELYGRTGHGVGLNPLSTAGGSAGWNGDRGERIRSVFRDEVRRLNPSDVKEFAREASMGDSTGVIPTHARSPTDMSIRLSPEPRFLLIRHWSLYDSMLHSPYLSARLHIWSEAGRRRLHKLLAKMGVSLSQSKQSYTHMDMDIKRGLRERLLKYAPVYGLDGLVPPPSRNGDIKDGWGFVRFWGWKACLSAVDAGVILGAMLEVGDVKSLQQSTFDSNNLTSTQSQRNGETLNPDSLEEFFENGEAQEAITSRFWTAYDALSSIDLLTKQIPTAQHLHRAILRTGTSLIEKKQIRHLRAFRMAVVKEGPDVQLFTHPGALTKLALWIAEAIVEMHGVKGKRKGGELVMAGLDETRGVYIVVGLGGGGAVISAKERIAKREARKKEKAQRRAEKRREKEKRKQDRLQRAIAAGLEEDELEYSSDEDEDEDDEDSDSEGNDSEDERQEEQQARGYGKNRFGVAFANVAQQTNARIRQDAFEHCVIEIRKEDLSGFLEKLCMEAVVG